MNLISSNEYSKPNELSFLSETSQKNHVKNFVSVIPTLYANGLAKGYRWQIGHPLRQEALQSLGGLGLLPYLISRFANDVCTLSAANVFSIFLEYTEKPKQILQNKKGINVFATEIKEFLEIENEKGLVCFCSLICKNSTIHQFVIEVTLEKTCHFYQSYISHYTIQQNFDQKQSMPIEEFIEKMKTLTLSSNEYTEQRKKAFNDLFHATGSFSNLEFFYLSIKYETTRIPSLPKPLTLTERIKNIWFNFIELLKIAMHSSI